MTGPLVVGVDLSLTSTGVVTSAGGVHRIQSKGTRADSYPARWVRLTAIAEEAAGLCEHATLVVVEGPAYNAPGGSTHDRSGLWWLFVSAIMADRRPVAVVSPMARAKYASGLGNASKDHCLTEVIRRYDQFLVTGNDVADALTLCAMGRDYLGHPLAQAPVRNRLALEKVSWPLGMET